MLLDLLGYAGNALDLPGSSVRDLLTGNNPFDQWATPFSDQNRASGRDVLAPLLGANQATGIGGWFDNPMEGVKDVLGFGTEMVLDPTNIVGSGVVRGLAKSRKAIEAAERTAKLREAGKYGYVNARVLADQMLNPMSEVAPAQKLLGYTPERPRVFHGGHDWAKSATPEHPYGMFDLGRIGTGEGNAAFTQGMYVADNPMVAEGYRNVVQEGLDDAVDGGIGQRYWEMLSDAADDDGLANMVRGPAADRFVAEMDEMVPMLKDPDVDTVHQWLRSNNWLGLDMTQSTDRGVIRSLLNGDEDTLELFDDIPQQVRDAISRNAPAKARIYQLDMPQSFRQNAITLDQPFTAQPGTAGQFFKDVLNPLDITDLNNRITQSVTDRVGAHQDWKYAIETGGDADAAYARYIQLRDASDALAAEKEEILASFAVTDEFNGADLLEEITTKIPARTKLADVQPLIDAGIPGVSFFDRWSRGAGEGTRNHVIWDQNIINQMRVRGIDGERVPINPTTTVVSKEVPRPQAPISREDMIQTIVNPMAPQVAANPEVTAGVLYNLLARQNSLGGLQ